MPTGTTYVPATWDSFEAGKSAPNVIGISQTASANTTTNIDTLVADDSFIRGIQLLARSSNPGDTLTIRVVDKDGVYFPANTVVSTPVTNYNIATDQQIQASYESIAPYKILGGLYIRVSYTSTSLLTAVTVAINYLLVKATV